MKARLARLLRPNVTHVPGARVETFPHEEVTRVAPTEVPAKEGGLDQEDVEAIWGSVQRLYDTGLHPAIGFCLRRKGQVMLDRTIGHRSGNSPQHGPESTRVIASPDDLFCLFSASKAITAMVIHLLDDRGLLHLDDAVFWHIPEFDGRDKEHITIRHVLTHRAGIPNLPKEYLTLDILADPDKIVALLCDAEVTWHPGRKLAYHPLTGGYILGELIKRVTGKDIRTFLREELLEPLGFSHCNFGVPADRVDEVAEHAWTGLPVVPPWSWLVKRALGVSYHDAVRFSNTPDFKTAIIPAGNLMATPNEASRFFQLLLDGGTLDGTKIFERRTIARAVAEQTYLEFDMTLGVPVRYSMGFFLGDRLFSLYGPNTPRAFGHLGFTTVNVWADPQREVSVALLTTGKPLLTPGQFYFWDVARTISERCA